jgi:hypothetical protein
VQQAIESSKRKWRAEANEHNRGRKKVLVWLTDLNAQFNGTWLSMVWGHKSQSRKNKSPGHQLTNA